MSKSEHPRKCENWLVDFLQWTIPRSEAKESYIFWTGLYTLAATLRRHVKVPKEWLGSWECYPYLYLLFLGPAGNRKTTTTSYNIELLDEVPGLVPVPDQITVQKLASALAEAEECSMYINAGELSEFIAKSGKDMYSFLTKAFDGSKRLSVGTHMRGIELAEKPCINFLGATTVEMLGEILPQASLDGGFGRRCLFVYEEEVRRKKMLYKDVDIKGIHEKYHKPLIEDLKFIANNLFGDFSFTDDAAKKFEEWYVDGAGIKNKRNGRVNNRLKGYYETKPAFVMKAAMLLKIADGNIIHKDQLVLDWKSLEEAIQLIESTEGSMNQALGDIGKNVYKSDIKQIYRFICDNEPVYMSIVLREFQAVAEPAKLSELIQGLSSAGLINVEPNGTELVLSSRKK